MSGTSQWVTWDESYLILSLTNERNFQTAYKSIWNTIVPQTSFIHEFHSSVCLTFHANFPDWKQTIRILRAAANLWKSSSVVWASNEYLIFDCLAKLWLSRQIARNSRRFRRSHEKRKVSRASRPDHTKIKIVSHSKRPTSYAVSSLTAKVIKFLSH